MDDLCSRPSSRATLDRVCPIVWSVPLATLFGTDASATVSLFVQKYDERLPKNPKYDCSLPPELGVWVVKSSAALVLLDPIFTSRFCILYSSFFLYLCIIVIFKIIISLFFS